MVDRDDDLGGDKGRVLIMLGGLEKSSEMIIRTLSEDRLAAAQHRTQVNKQLADLTERLQAVEHGQRTTASDIADIKPKVATIEVRHHEITGAAHFGKWMWTLIAGGAGAGIVSAAQWLLGGHK